jgi:hypothetical protein
MQEQREGTHKMPINPKYAAIVEKNKSKGDSKYGDKNYVYLNNVGDGVQGTIVRVSEIMEKEKTFPGSEPRKIDVQYIDLKDVKVRKLDPSKGEFVVEDLPEATFKLDKGGHFEAVFAALMEIDQSDPEPGNAFKIQRLGNDDKRHVFAAKLGKDKAPF